MSRLEGAFKLFSKKGFKFLFLELIIVFLGVYLAFLIQSYTAQKQVESEKEKVLIGLKEDLEYFRLFFPGYATNAERLVQNWNETYVSGNYSDFYSWRFIQPQYDYTAIEYALEADADVIDFELNSSVSEVYQELQKLQHTELLITEIAMKYVRVPMELRNEPAGKINEANNMHNFRLFIDRAVDRHRIMNRIAELSGNVLPDINSSFSPDELKAIEVELIAKELNLANEQQVQAYLPMLLNYFPNLSEEEIRAALNNPD